MGFHMPVSYSCFLCTAPIPPASMSARGTVPRQNAPGGSKLLHRKQSEKLKKRKKGFCVLRHFEMFFLKKVEKSD